jgi:hypothetical protein
MGVGIFRGAVEQPQSSGDVMNRLFEEQELKNAGMRILSSAAAIQL